MKGNHPPLAREGWIHILLTLMTTIGTGVFFGWLWSVPLFLVFLFCVQFFRDPRRETPQGDGLVVSPADGSITTVGIVANPYGSGDVLKISIFMNIFNVHSNRIPCDGEVADSVHHQGNFFNASLDKASEGNERQVSRINSSVGEVVLVQVAGLIARRIICHLRKGQKVGVGDRFGFIRFGSRVDLYLPSDSNPRVSVGDKVKGGIHIVAEFPQETASDEH